MGRKGDTALASGRGAVWASKAVWTVLVCGPVVPALLQRDFGVIFTVTLVVYLTGVLVFVKRQVRLPNGMPSTFSGNLFEGNSESRAICSNFSSFVSIGVVGTFFMAPGYAFIHQLTLNDGWSGTTIVGLSALYAAALPFGLWALWLISYRERNSDTDSNRARNRAEEEQTLPEDRPMTYLKYFPQDLFFGGWGVSLVWLAMMVFTLLVIFGEVLLFKFVFDELLFPSAELAMNSALIVAVSTVVCTIYVEKHWFRTVLATDVMQFRLIWLGIGIILVCFVFAGARSALSKEHKEVVAPEGGREYRELIAEEVNAIEARDITVPVRTGLFIVSSAGMMIVMVCWFLAAPSSWILNVSTPRLSSPQPNRPQAQLEDGKKQSPKPRLMWKRVFIVAAVLLFVICFLTAILGFSTVHTVLNQSGCQAPTLAAQWHDPGMHQSSHLPRALKSFSGAFDGQNGLLPTVIAVLVCLTVLLCFHTTLDTNLVAAAQLIFEARALSVPLFSAQAPEKSARRLLRSLRVGIPCMVLLLPELSTFGGMFILLGVVGVASCFVAVWLGMMLLSTVMLPKLGNCRLDGWAMIGGTLGGIVAATLVWMWWGWSMDGALKDAGVFENSDVRWIVYGASEIAALALGFLVFVIVIAVVRKRALEVPSRTHRESPRVFDNPAARRTRISPGNCSDVSRDWTKELKDSISVMGILILIAFWPMIRSSWEPTISPEPAGRPRSGIERRYLFVPADYDFRESAPNPSTCPVEFRDLWSSLDVGEEKFKARIQEFQEVREDESDKRWLHVRRDFERDEAEIGIVLGDDTIVLEDPKSIAAAIKSSLDDYKPSPALEVARKALVKYLEKGLPRDICGLEGRQWLLKWSAFFRPQTPSAASEGSWGRKNAC